MLYTHKEVLPNFVIGDQMKITLAGLGDFIATVHKVTDGAVLFIFDDYVAVRQMNATNKNEGGFAGSDLNEWMQSYLLGTFPVWLRDRIYGLSIPSVGEVFGHADNWNGDIFEPDYDEQLELMRKGVYRTAEYNGKLCWGWLRNATDRIFSASYFAGIGRDGSSSSCGASRSCGVRPEFWLNKADDVGINENHAEQIWQIFQSYQNVGFTKDQAFELTRMQRGTFR